MRNTVVNSYWEAPSTKETGLRWHWKLGNVPAQFSSCCLMNYALHLGQLNYAGSNSKRASFCTTWPKAMSFSSWSVFLLVTFFERVRTVYFFPYLPLICLAGSLKSPCIIWREFWDSSDTFGLSWLSARCHQQSSDLNARFPKNMDSQRKQQFPLSYYNLMLISNPFYFWPLEFISFHY